ncbi:MAG: hypothetical protein HY788_23700 [Deltaproteobacteria bacterium]|nr:hypothetical protein [Deltaproteobacteria bacterium]
MLTSKHQTGTRDACEAKLAWTRPGAAFHRYPRNRKRAIFGDAKYREDMKAKNLDKKFDAWQDITELLDLSIASWPGQEQKKVIRK